MHECIFRASAQNVLHKCRKRAEPLLQVLRYNRKLQSLFGEETLGARSGPLFKFA